MPVTSPERRGARLCEKRQGPLSLVFSTLQQIRLFHSHECSNGKEEKKASLSGGGAGGEVGGWREGEMDYSKVTFQKLIKGHDTRNDVE
uniref:Uncharacterized protein n=1 Tax=Haplochromis burtoni TaxID=8153 RepID=A0A3Q2VPR4_HAPBU